MSLVIRTAHIDESELLSQIAWDAKSHWGYPPQTMNAWREELTIDVSRDTEFPTMVAECDGKIAGTYRLARDDRNLELDFLWIHSSFMRKGIGKALVAHAIAKAHSQGVSRLNIDADPNAVEFYEKCGARRIGTVAAPIDEQPNRVRHLLAIDLRN